ncbi:MAG: hypothetical protein RIT81_40355 [Deltaproteobacteria bacterium]
MLAALLVLGALSGQTAVERVPGWVTFGVANPKALGGHRILHLEDVIGARARDDIAGLPSPKVVVLFLVTPSDCPGPAKTGASRTFCDQMTGFATRPWAKGSLFVGVVLAEEETAGEARAKLLRSEYPYPVSVDEHGIVRRALKSDRPGEVLVVDSRLEVVRLAPPARSEGVSWDRHLGRIRVAIERALEREGETKGE